MRSSAALAYLLFVTGVPSTALAGSNEQARLEFRDGRPVVDGVYVNGHGPYRFLVDTGSTCNHLEESLAQAIGLPITLHTTLVSSVGTTYAWGFDNAQIRLGSAQAGQQVILFDGMETAHKISSSIDGVLGQSFLSKFDYLIDVRTGHLQFGPLATSTALPKTPFETVAGRPILSTSLGALVLDSGAPRVIRFGIDGEPGMAKLFTVAGEASVGIIFSTLVVEGRTLWQGDALAVRQSPEVRTQGLLPVSPFRFIYVCNSERYVVLAPEFVRR